MADIILDEVVALAFKLTLADQARLLERVAAHLAREVATPPMPVLGESLSGAVFEVWSPHDEGGAVAALNTALAEHKAQK